MCHIGRSALRVRRAGDAVVDEELLDHPDGQLQTLLTVLACAVLALWLTAERWLQNEPGAAWDKYLPLLLVLAAYAFSLPLLSHIRGWVEIALVAALLSAHMGRLQPGNDRTVRVYFAALCVAVLGINGALSWRHHQRLFDEQFAAGLPPPAVRLVPARTVDDLVAEVRSVRGTLEKRAQEDDDSDTSDAED